MPSSTPFPLLVLLREIRAVWRLACTLGLVLLGLGVVRSLFPRWPTSRCRHFKQAWARLLVGALGVRIAPCQPALPASALIVCNHISWLDVFILNALSEATFVCKDEVKAWPGIGTLVHYSGTLFIERGSRAAAARTAQAIADRLAGEERVAVFPEGTTTQGSSLLPFKAALFQSAIQAGAPVHPVCLRYADAQGQPSTAPAYDGDLSFVRSLLNIARSSRLQARLNFLEPLPPGQERRQLAREAETRIAAALNLPAPLHDTFAPQETPDIDTEPALVTD